MYARAGQHREWEINGAPTGMVGTAEFSIEDGEGGVVLDPTTEGINESPAGSGSYTVAFDAPEGEIGEQFKLVLDGGVNGVATEQLEITATGLADPGDSGYDLTTEVGQVRLEIGDTNATSPLYSDAEIAYFIGREGSVLGGAAAACEALARRYAHDADFAQDDTSVKRGERAKTFADLAAQLRIRASGGLRTVRTQRVDGYSDDIPNRGEPGELTSAGRTRDRWYVGAGRGR